MHRVIRKVYKQALLAATFLVTMAGSSAAQTFVFRVTDVVLKADDARPATCPLTITFHGYITANGPGVVRYIFAHSDGPGVPRDVGPHELVFRSAGTQRVSATWTFNDLGGMSRYEGWETIKILSPIPMESSPRTGGFALNCPQLARAANSPQAVTVAPVGGRFRVTLNGFRVNRQTRDDSLEREGPGDEVFVRDDSFKINSAGGLGTISREGSSSRGSTLHVHTGDSVPSGSPETGSLHTYYEGEIDQRETAVAIFPVLWEWDSDHEDQTLGDKFLSMASNPALGRYVSRVIASSTGTDLSDFIKPGSEIGLPLNVTLGHGPLGLGEVGNRPIGMTRRGDRYVFDPKVLILTYEAANMVSHTDFGHGAGIIELRFQDDRDLEGDYTLFVQVQRLP